MTILYFIKRIFLVTMATFSMLVILILVPHLLIHKFATFKIDTKIKTASFGYSHSECAFNDTLIKDFINCSESAESYFYTYPKLKKVLIQNPQIETVFIEYSNKQVDQIINEWIWGYSKMSSAFSKYTPFLEKNDFELLLKNNRRDLIPCLSISTRSSIYNVLRFNFDYSHKIGGYQRLDRDNTDSLIKVRNNMPSDSTIDTFHISEINLLYLRKIIDFCKVQGKAVYLIRCPQHRFYDYLYNEPYFIQIKNERFQDVEFLDFNNFPLTNNEFADFGHLNYKGANKFSLWVNHILSNGLLTSMNKQVFIDSCMSSIQITKN